MRLVTEGFETGSLYQPGWSVYGSFNTTNVRSGTYCFSLIASTSYPYGLGIPLSSRPNEIFFKFAAYFGGSIAADTAICGIHSNEGITDRAIMALTPSGGPGTPAKLRIYDGAAWIDSGTGTTPLLSSQWMVFQIHFRFDPIGTSLIEVCINSNTPEITWTGDFRDIWNSTFDGYTWNGLSGVSIGTRSLLGTTWWYTANSVTNVERIDDIAINDASGPYHDSWPGLTKIVALKPNADTSQKQWSASTGSDNYALVDEVPHDGDSTYVYTSTEGAQDHYAVTDPPDLTGLEIAGVWSEVIARKVDSASTATVVPGMVSNGAEAWGIAKSMGTGYTRGFDSGYVALNPLTGQPWTADEVKNLYLGIKTAKTAE